MFAYAEHCEEEKSAEIASERIGRRKRKHMKFSENTLQLPINIPHSMIKKKL